AWQPRPDGQPVEDRRLRGRASRESRIANRPEELSGATHAAEQCHLPPATEANEADCGQPPLPTRDSRLATRASRAIADMTGPAAAPRKNGELVFEAPWQ